MDHFQLPRHPTCRLPRVPYVCSVPYDEGDFLTYPARGGQQWAHLLSSEWRLAFTMAEHQNPSDTRQLEDFFQRWFFFGLLHAVLSQVGLYDAEDYIERDEDGLPAFVHTRNLEARLRSWAEHIKRDDVDKLLVRNTLQACLQRAHDVLSSISTIGDHPNRHTSFDQAVKCSIADLCGTVSAFGELNLGEDPSIPWNNFHGFATDVDEQAIANMKRNGWCERDATEEGWSQYSTALYWYIKALGDASPAVDHSTCSSIDCKTETIHRDSYRPGHVSDDCDCTLLGPEHIEVADILNSGHIPVLDIEGDSIQNISLKMVPITPDITYIALSHVWADGLGNPKSLAVARCQLLRLRRLMDRMYGQTFRWYDGTEICEKRRLHIWVDSLLVPIAMRSTAADDLDFDSRPDVIQSLELYKLAMGKMREVYAKATYVLVLDSALCRLRYSEMDAVEAIVRVHTSRWVRRLWTYQEAALAEKLLIQFADQAIDYRDLAQAAKAGYLDPMRRRLCAPIVFKWMELRSYRGRQDTGGIDLEALPYTMHYRRATDRSDQPICAATLLDLDTAQVAAGKDMSARMATFWRLLSESDRMLPDNIIFNLMPRLTMPGFRWAPSLLAFGKANTQRIMFVPDLAKPARLTPEGLVVSLPCIQISAHHPPFGTDTALWQNLYTDVGLLHLRSADGRWFRATACHPDHKPSDRGPAAIVANDPTARWHILLDGGSWTDAHKTRSGLLGTVVPQGSGPPVFVSRLLVAILEFQPANRIVSETGTQHGLIIQRGYNFKLYQLLFACKSVLDFWSEFLPDRTRYLVRTFYTPRMVAFMDPYICNIAAQMSWYGQAANQSADVATAMTQISPPGSNAQGYLTSYVLLEILARRANIDKWLDDRHEWCIE